MTPRAAPRLPLEPEQRFVFALARTGTVPPVPARADWPRLLFFAQRQGAGVALSRALPQLQAAGVPAPVEAAVRRVGMTGSFAQRYLLGRLQGSVTALSRAGIRVMPLKGAAFLLADPERGMTRTMGDIDLLVRPADLARARAVLLGQGWATSALEAKADFYAAHHHLPPLDDTRGTGLSLELHAEPFPPGHPFLLDAGDLWRTAVPYPGLDGVMLPSPRAALLHACIHFAWAHMAESGAWRLVRDVDALASGGDLDWEAFAREARAVRAGTACYWSLRLAAELGGVRVPAATLALLAPRQPEALRARLLRHLVLQGLELAPCPSRLLRQGLWRAMIQPGREGHGAARPWARNAEFGVPEREAAPPGGALARLRRVPAVLRYLGRAFGAGAGRFAGASGSPAAGAPLA